jgi:hypothetical protein
MSKESLWSGVVAKTPQFGGGGGETVTLTKRGLKRLFDLAYEGGEADGIKTGYTQGVDAVSRAAQAQARSKKNGAGERFFEDFFGKFSKRS